MNKILIPREQLLSRGLPYRDSVIQSTLVGFDTWGVIEEIVFEWTDGKTYKTTWIISPYDEPWTYLGEVDNEVECIEVQKLQRLVDVWEANNE